MIIDVSSNNGMIDWHTVANNNPKPEGVIIKVNEGYLCADTKAKYNSTQYGLLNIPVGYYHFATLNNANVVADAEQEANYFLTSLNDLTPSTLPLALDIETNKTNLPPAQVVLWAKTFFNVLREAGKTNLALYSGLAFLNQEHFVVGDFPGVKLWVAEYTASALKLPTGFSDYWMWQYSDAATIAGIVGHVDVSKVNPAHASS
jgi:lysozyme